LIQLNEESMKIRLNPEYKLKNKVEKRKYLNERSYAPSDLANWPNLGRETRQMPCLHDFVATDGKAFAPLSSDALPFQLLL